MAVESARLAPEWHTLGTEEVLRQLEVDPQRGLSEEEVQTRLAQYGRNELEEGKTRGVLAILLDQFKETMVLVLIGAAVISGILGEFKDTIAILIIILLNSLLGLTQEYRAEKAMAALKKLSNPIVKVRRNGSVQKEPSDQLVPGDVILLEAGDSIPADALADRCRKSAGAGGGADRRVDPGRQGPGRHVCA